MTNDSLFESIRDIVESLQALNPQAVEAYTPIIEDILRSRSQDKNYIERTLDLSITHIFSQKTALA